MKDNFSLNTTPVEEDCAQLGSENYLENTERECSAYIGQLKRTFGKPPPNARFRVTKNPHDFGMYHDVVVEFDDEDVKASKYAYKIEANLPDKWDEQALMVVRGTEIVSLDLNTDHDMNDIVNVLKDFGYTQVSNVFAPSQFAIRGGILDVFSFGNAHPFRIEFTWEITSLRSFDENTQEPIDMLDHVSLYTLKY